MRITLDMKQAKKELKSLSDLTGSTLRDLMYDQGRLLAQDAVRRVPPGGPQDGTALQKSKGAGAIAGDLQTMFAPFDNEAVIDKWAEDLDRAGFEVFKVTKRGVKRLMKFQASRAGVSDMAAKHKAHRSKRTGRVKFTLDRDKVADGKFLVPQNVFRKYLREQIKSVGKLKAGFVPAADYFASLVGTSAKSIPAWVRKQSVRSGTYTNAVNRQTGVGYLEAVNSVEYSDRAIAKSTLSWLESNRQRDINRHAKRRLSKLAREHNNKYARAA